MTTNSLSLVFPAYNEGLNLRTLVESAFSNARKLTEDFEVIVVDDGSTDDTERILNLLKKEYGSNLTSIHLKPNKGYAAALRTGFKNSKKDLIFYSDSDNQFDFSEIPLLLEHINGNDMVIGYRRDRKDNFLRLFLSKGYNIMIRVLFGLKVKDIDCAFKLFRRDIFDKIDIVLERVMVDTEILLKAKSLGMRMKEVGVTHLPRLKGSSTVKAQDIVFTLKNLFKLKGELKKLKRDSR